MSIFGLDCDDPIPEGYVLMEAFAVLKGLDENGKPCLVVRHTPSCDYVLAVGMLTLALEQQKEESTFQWIGDEEDEDDD